LVRAIPIPLDDEERVLALEALGVLDTPPEERFDPRHAARPAHVRRLDRHGEPRRPRSPVHEVLPGLPAREHVAFRDVLRAQILDAAGLVVEDLEQDSRFADSAFVVGDPRLRFYAGVPLEAPGGQRVGTLCIADSKPRELTDADRALLRDFAIWVQNELNVAEELDRAAQVQRAMFPARALNAPGWDVAGACLPSREVGGDFYDWHRTPTGPVVTLGDVMGVDGTVEPQVSGGLPLGISVDEQYANQRLLLGPGDMLVLHSDGLLELAGGPRSTAEAAARVTGSASAADAIERLLAVCDGATLPDDVTVVAMLRQP
jgi:serine phosphatase RsbU (regulator of sigma subunit)